MNDERLVAFIYSCAGMAEVLVGNFQMARQYGREGIRRYRVLQDRWGEAHALSALGMTQFFRGHYAQAIPLLVRARRQVITIGEVMGTVWIQGFLADSVMVCGNLVWARELLESNLELCQMIGFRTRLGSTYVSLGRLALLEHDLVQAELCFRRSFKLAKLTDDELTQSHACAGLARVLAQIGRHEHAAIVLSAAEQARARIGAALDPREHAVRSSCRDELSRALGDSAFNRAWKQGQSLRLDELFVRSPLSEQSSEIADRI